MSEHPPVTPVPDPPRPHGVEDFRTSEHPRAPQGAAAARAPGEARPELSDEVAGLLGAEGLRPVSPKLIPARYLAGIVGYLILLAAAAGLVVLTATLGWWWPAVLALLPLILFVQSLLFTPRRVRAIGYRDGKDDLTVASGIMFRDVQTIPYGRVQSVKIDEGPVDRRYGLAKLSVTTAASGADVTLPGLPREEADRLHGLLTARGIENMAAL